MQFIAMISRRKGVSLGESMNALMHLSLGVGHRLEGRPSINIFVGDDDKLRAFRSLTKKMADESSALVSDFPHTMVGGNTDVQLEVGRATPEADMHYLAAFFTAKTIPAELQTFLETCDQFEGYKPYESAERVHQLAAQEDYSSEVTGKKIVLVINPEQPFSLTINACVLAALRVGYAADFEDLRLLNVRDADGQVHPNISYHPFPVLKAKKDAFHQEMDQEAEFTDGLVCYTEKDVTGQFLATVAFGDRSDVEDVFRREKTELFRSKFPPLAAQARGAASREGMFASSAKAAEGAPKLEKEFRSLTL